MKKISQILGSGYGASVENLEEDQDSNDVREAALKIALHILRDMKEKDLVEKLIKCKPDTLPLIKITWI